MYLKKSLVALFATVFMVQGFDSVIASSKAKKNTRKSIKAIEDNTHGAAEPRYKRSSDRKKKANRSKKNKNQSAQAGKKFNPTRTKREAEKEEMQGQRFGWEVKKQKPVIASKK